MRQAHPIRHTWLAAIFLLAGCPDSSNTETVTGEGSIQALHAVPNLGSVSFMIEETLLSTLTYKQSSGITEFDNLEYTFRFDVLLPGDEDVTTLASSLLTVDDETEYTFILAGSVAEPEIIIWEQFGRDWIDEIDTAVENDTTVTVMEVSFGNLASQLGTVDVYLEATGTSPEFASPRTTIGYADLKTAIELPSAEYQLVLTPVGEPDNIIFASDPIFIDAATSNMLTIMDDAGATTAPFSVRWIGTSLGIDLYDINLLSELSVVHGALGTGSVDVVSGGNFGAPLVEDLEYANSSTGITVDPGTLNINVTPAGNQGVFLAERAFEITKGSFNRLYLVGLPGDVQAALFAENRQPIDTHARFQLFQGATRFAAVDVYIVATDVDISLIGPSFSTMIYGTSTGHVTVAPDEYNLVVTEAGTKNIIGGPYLLNLAAGENTGSMILDSPSITATEILLFDLNNP
ncbi:MAG: DUF4397 domain-containing protein [Gammaproteobacteria bacterium]|nr:DUF4397 domain-containing protein [Gammaproteobacteria bacterium]